MDQNQFLREIRVEHHERMFQSMSLEKAARIQRDLSSKLILKWDDRPVDLVAGADFGYDRKAKKIGASIIVFRLPEFKIVETAEAVRELRFPYIPGYLSFREVPVDSPWGYCSRCPWDLVAFFQFPAGALDLEQNRSPVLKIALYIDHLSKKWEV